MSDHVHVRITTIGGGCIDFDVPADNFNFAALMASIRDLGYFQTIGDRGCLYVPAAAISTISAKPTGGEGGEVGAVTQGMTRQ